MGLVNLGIWNELRKNRPDAVVLMSWMNPTWWLAIIGCVRYKIPFLYLTDSNIQAEIQNPRQLDLLAKFNFDAELTALPLDDPGTGSYFYRNKFFESGDAEYLFNMIRYFKPTNIIEIGGGYSTLMVRHAIQKNTAEDSDYACDHTCIEPYEQQWLEKTGANIIRKNVQDVDLEIFGALDMNDLLFIDSSHVVRPQGDVLFEHQEVLGSKAVWLSTCMIFSRPETIQSNGY